MSLWITGALIGVFVLLGLKVRQYTLVNRLAVASAAAGIPALVYLTW
jgi:hypothetical protein